ncbi:MAG: adenosine kinase [Desulfobacteraceae bacterium]|nr:adenosine kinase [Desulfobacteraceae bacterium]
MTYVGSEEIDKTLSRSTNKPTIVPGGSVCNTIVGVSKLGGAARFVGQCGKGRLGNFFKSDLMRQHVEPSLFYSDDPTGRVLSIITPDAQRSMMTYLGAASQMDPAKIDKDCFKGAAIVYVEGYLLFNPELIRAALKAARAVGAKIALDLASFNVVEESKPLLDEIVTDYVDILIANEDEAMAFTGYAGESDALRALAELAEIAVLKVGKRGSYIYRSGKEIRIHPTGNGDIVDTTGAGDLWASGFLYGLVNGLTLETCGQLGSACGYEVCRVIGANIPDDGWARIKRILAP